MLTWFKASPDEIYQHIEALFNKDIIDWELISCHLPDMLQVAQSIRAGRLSPSTILRKLGTASRKNKLYFAFRELGRVIRTLLLLEYIGDEELHRIIHAAQNKCEGFNRFTQWVHFGADKITDNVRDEQLKVIKYNHLNGDLRALNFNLKSLYINLCNCLILICSIQHQKQVNLWTKNRCRLWLTNWPKILKPLRISTSSIAC
nr:transposase [Serratia marcescens]